MRVLFVNPPVVRSDDSSPENDFRLDGLTFPAWLKRVPGSWRLWRALNIGGSIRYGVRAGSRWPWTIQMLRGSPHYPFFMGYAAAMVSQEGHEVNIFDSVAEEEYSYSSFVKRVKLWRPDLIIMECSTPTIDIDLWIANKLTDIADVALAGPYFATNDMVVDVQNTYPLIKYILQGEYINSARLLVRSLKPGVYSSDVVKNLDDIPYPYREYSAAKKYFDPSMPTPKPQLQIYGSKGCPFKCSFCVWPQIMYKGCVSLRDPARIAEEIRSAVLQHGYRSIFFDDDTFNMGTERISNLCDYLKEIALPWTMMGRLDISPHWLFDKMVDSGCVGMRFGVETFDIQVLARVNKGIERSDFCGTLRHLCSAYPDIMIHITMMKDMPGQSEASHLNDMRIIQEMGFSTDNIHRSYQLSRCAPFPGTVLYEQLKSEGFEDALGDYRNYDGGKDTVMKVING